MNKEASSTILFFDDWYLSHRENLVRHIGQPTLVSEGVFEDPHLGVAWAYPSVFRDPNTTRWRCLYQGRMLEREVRRDQHMAVAIESEDGIHWQIPDLSDRVQISDRRFPHQVLPLERFGEWGPCYFDAMTENPDERVKGFVSYRTEQFGKCFADLYVSPNGLSWHRLEGIKWHPWGIDPAVSAFWNKYRETYVMTSRPSWADRRQSVYETRDWRNFSKPELAMQSDALDTPAAEIYGMPVFPYEDMFVGLLWVYHTKPVVDASHKFYYGKVDCQLAYSYNGLHFHRGLREPLLSNTEPGEHASGCIYPCSLLIDEDHRIRIYSSSSKVEHAQDYLCPDLHDRGALLLHQLRLDGFVYLEPAAGPGVFTTCLLFWEGEDLEINIRVPYGEARVQITDESGKPFKGYRFEDCNPFTGDELFWKPQWKNNKSLSELTGKVLRIQVQLINGRIYALRGDFDPIGVVDFHKFKAQGKRPKPIYEYYQ